MTALTALEQLKLLGTSPLHRMLVKEINDDLAWLANERERERRASPK